MILSKLRQFLRANRPVQERENAEPALLEPKPMPRILGLSMVKNEQDIIEPFIRHNIRYLDALIVMDNASVDRTRAIALECARELGNVIICDSPEFEYNQSQRMTKLLHFAQSAFFADYVLFIDADEFISAPGKEALLEQLSQIPEGGVGRMPWKTFVVRPGQESAVGRDAPRAFSHRRAEEQPPFYKAALRLGSAYVPELVVVQGNHDVARHGELLPGIDLEGLPLLHFPVRSPAQLAGKSIVGWTAYVACNLEARNKSEGFQWRQAFDAISGGGIAAVSEALASASMNYAQDGQTASRPEPVPDAAPSNYVRRYSNGQYMDPLALVARSWEQSLTPVAPSVQLHRPEVMAAEAGVTATSFDASWHWDHLFFDIPPFRYIAEKYQPKSVLDIGCGIGQYLALFKAHGASAVFGIDGVPAEATRGVVEPGEYDSIDLTRAIALNQTFDLVLCVEVAEHLEETDCAVLLDTIGRHASQRIIFSAAEIGQPGHGHINCQQLPYWLTEWERRGWVPDLNDSLGMRALATMSWFRRNLVVLRRKEDPDDRSAAQKLIEISEKSYLWYDQEPGIREMPFLEPLFGPGQAYHPRS